MMKKRMLSLILAVLIIAGMAPFSAFAASSGATLQFSGSWDPNNLQSSMNLSADGNPTAKFYLVDGSTKEEVTSGLTFPDFIESGYNAEGQGWLLNVKGTGTGSISYTKDNTTYTLPVTSRLPSLGVYSSEQADAGSIIRFFTLSETNNSFYVALSSDVFNNGNGWKLASVNETFGSEVTDPNITRVADVEISSDGRYAKVTVKDTTAAGGYHIQFTRKDSSDPSRTDNIGRSLYIVNDMPRLYFCPADRNDSDQWAVCTEQAQESASLTPGYYTTGCFYYGSRTDVEAGNAEPISRGSLTFPDYLEIKDASEYGCNAENAVTLHSTRVQKSGEGTNITYRLNSTDYTFPFESVLPNIGFYTTTEAKDDTLIYDGNPFTVTETDRTVYLCASNPANIRITGIARWYDNEDIFTVQDCTDSNGNKYLSFTVKAGKTVPTVGTGLDINVERSNGDGTYHSETLWVMLCLKNGVPGLMFRYAEYDDTTGTWVESKNNCLEYSLTLNKDDSSICNFYYGTEDSYAPVAFEELTMPSNIFCTDEGSRMVCIYGTGFKESGDITYTDANGKVVTLPVTVNQPTFGFYSSQNADASTYLGRDVNIGSTSDAFYLIFNENDFGNASLSVDSIRSETDGSDAKDRFNIAVNGCCITLSPKGDPLPTGGSYAITVSCGDGEWTFSFNLNRTDLTKLSTPTDLRWNINYDTAADGTRGPTYAERNGVMSFTAEGSQNCFSLEIYSSADGYQAPVSSCYFNMEDTDSSKYFSINHFIYSDMPSGTYKFRVRANGDGTQYCNSDWSPLSAAWTYTRPSQRLTAPGSSTFGWTKDDGMYWATWQKTGEAAVGSYDTEWYAENDDGSKEYLMGNGTIGSSDSTVRDAMADFILEQSGTRKITFRVRAVPEDITQYRMSVWSDCSAAFDVANVAVSVNSKLDDIEQTASPVEIVEEVQEELKTDTAELYTAMSADAGAEKSGGASTGTLDKIRSLETAVTRNNAVTTEITVDDSAPQALKDIKSGVTMVGAALNADTKNVTAGQTPSVKLVISKADEGSIIDTQERNAVQFSMKLNGGVDSDSNSGNGQQLVVPIVLDMPVPEGINPNFLVILHKHSDGTIDEIFPYKYTDDNGRTHAVFTVKSFSTFAFVEYHDTAVTVTAKPETKSFSDVRAGSYYAEAVQWATEKGVTTGTGDGTTFSPDDPCTRGQIVTFLWRAADSPEPKSLRSFTDVPADSYCAKAIAWAVENGITDGTGSGKFSPNDPCTRAQAVTFLYRAAGSPAVSSCAAFDDVPANAYCAGAVEWAAAGGITKGTTDTTFSPNDDCIRAQIVTFLWRAYSK